MLTVEQTTRSYTGKPACMCGCNGTYNDSERARKMAITALLKNPKARYDSWGVGEGAVFVVTATRNRCLYLTAEGVRAVAAMGIEPE
jgi:hypothetical protein